jgi:uncharacterized protein (DUF488 family)
MSSGEFAAGLERLRRFAAVRRTAVMCAEAQWWRCHRRLLSDALLAQDVEVLHIDSRGGSERHQLTEFARVQDGRVSYPPRQGRLEI